MTNELPTRLRAIAESVTEWDNPLCAKEDLLKAADMLQEQQAEIERLTKCYATATGKIGACGSSSLMRIECKQMTELRDEIEHLKNIIADTDKWEKASSTSALHEGYDLGASSFDKEIDELNGEIDWLRNVVKAVVDWNERYPSSRIYNHDRIVKIAAEMDAIFEQAKQALGKEGEWKNEN